MPIGDETVRDVPEFRSVDPLIGTTVGEYRVLELVGAGSMGVVYRAKHEVIGRTVAMKVLKVEFKDDTEMVERVLREARMLASLAHPGIVDVHTFGVLKNGQPYLVMEMLEGEPLDVFIRREAPALVKTAVPLVDDVLAALSAAHQMGVVHRDLKPGNIFLRRNANGAPTVKLLDFGLARQAQNAGDSIKPTHPNTMVGTPAFMAPEQVLGGSVTAATDLYAVGGIAYQLLTGHLPHEGPTAVDVLSQKMNHLPLPPKKWVKAIDTELSDWLLWLLERDLAKRPQSAEQARAKLRRLASSKTVPAGTLSVGPSSRGLSVTRNAVSSPSPVGPVPSEDDSLRPTEFVAQAQHLPTVANRALWLWVLLLVLATIASGLAAWLLNR